jgi:hypothetical protein
MNEPTPSRLTPTVYTWGTLIVLLPICLFMAWVGLLALGAAFGIGPGEIVHVGEYANVEPPPWGLPLVLTVLVLLWSFIFRSVYLALCVRYSRGRIEELNRKVVLQPMLGRSRTVHFDSLIGYSTCSIPGRFYVQGYGVALYLKNGGHIQLNAISTTGIRPLKKALSSAGVVWLGSERCWLYPFMKRRFKFDPK